MQLDAGQRIAFLHDENLCIEKELAERLDAIAPLGANAPTSGAGWVTPHQRRDSSVAGGHGAGRSGEGRLPAEPSRRAAPCCCSARGACRLNSYTVPSYCLQSV